MKLSKLYCNKDNFKNIEFNTRGINIVYADVKTKIQEKNNSHNLGKTLLSELIDFLLLKGVTKNHFLIKSIGEDGKQIFSDYVFYLELKLNSGRYLLIKRDVLNNTKISFKLSEQKIDGFPTPQDWDYENLAFKKAKERLGEFLNFSFFEGKEYDYRKAINYSLRRQGDFSDIYRLKKFSAGKDRDWKPFMFDLLGFNGEVLSKKYDLESNIEKEQNFIKNLRTEFSVSKEDRDDLVAQIQIREQKVKEVSLQVDNFNFYEQDKQLIQKGIRDIETKISDSNTLTYELEYEIVQLETSIRNKFAFDLEKVKKVFSETQIFFPEQLANDYEELLKFNKKLTNERNKLLRENLQQKEIALKKIRESLRKLNLEKENLLSFIQDTTTFKRFKEYQKGLVKIESELLKLQGKLNTIDTIISKESDIESLQDEINTIVKIVNEEYLKTEKNELYGKIRKSFSKFYKDILGEDAYISWSLNKQNNVDFKSPTVQNTDGRLRIDTSQGEGYTYTKLFCVCFDLAILTSYMTESFYRFIYHDDVLANEDNGVKHGLVSLIKELTSQYDLQYILSVIKDDLPVDEKEKPIEFDASEVILNLHDKDESGTLFGFSF